MTWLLGESAKGKGGSVIVVSSVKSTVRGLSSYANGGTRCCMLFFLAGTKLSSSLRIGLFVALVKGDFLEHTVGSGTCLGGD